MPQKVVLLPENQMSSSDAIRMKMEGRGIIVSMRENYKQIRVLHQFHGTQQYAFVDIYDTDPDPELYNINTAIEKEYNTPLVNVFWFSGMNEMVKYLLSQEEENRDPW